MKHITIKDVAKKVGVSVSSVSRALNDKSDIKRETRELILKAIEEMGYHPNPIAKKLHQQKSYNIGVVVPEFINEFYSEVIVAIQDVLAIKGYQVLIMHSDNSAELELKNVKTLIHNMVDGVIVAPTLEGDNMEYYLKMISTGFPMVFVNRVCEDLKASKVMFDNVKWSFFATEHLIREGYNKIYHLSGHDSLNVSNDRVEGFIKAMKKHNISEDRYKVIETGLLSEEGIETTENLIYNQDLPDAFFCVNDLVAMGVIKTLKKHDIKIPTDIGIVGFTETRMAELITPNLTSVKQPTLEMGRKAAELILMHINDESSEPVTALMNGQLNIRESSNR